MRAVVVRVNFDWVGVTKDVTSDVGCDVAVSAGTGQSTPSSRWVQT